MTRNRAGFTLIELLVVMAIIAILASLAVGGYGAIKQRAKVGAATSNIQALKTALGMYNKLTGVYPNRSQTPQDDPEALFKALYTGNPKLGGSRENHIEDWPPDQIGRWDGPREDPEAIWARPSEDELDFTTQYKRPLVLLDPWGRPYHYVEWDSYPMSERKLSSGQLKAQGATPYAIWSDGPNRKNEWGKGDDVTSWGGGG
jgi:prepilin-type N-terminal cleavage/methylation domain-containing protein